MNVFADAGELGPALGAVGWGCTVYEIQAGESVSRYHWHFGEEEWLLVLVGTPTLRTPAGERVLRPWDLVCFPRGEAGAHQVRNDAGDTARVAMLSSASDPEVTVYPESGEVGVFADWSRPDRGEMRLLAPYPGRRG